MHHPRQGRVHEPRSVREGPRGALHHQGRDRARHAPARRHDRRGHGRQYGHRPCPRRRRARLQDGHRHSRDAEPGEEGHAASRGRGARRGAGRALQKPEQLREGLGSARAGARPDRPGRRGVGEPVRQCRQPSCPCRDDRAGDLGGHRRHRRRLRLGRRHRRHARRRRHRPQGAQRAQSSSASQTRWEQPCTPSSRRAS